MRSRKPVTPFRIVAEFAVVLALQFALSFVLMQAHVLDHLLSPGRESVLALGVTTAFLLLRMFVMLFSAAWLFARLWLWWSAPARAAST